MSCSLLNHNLVAKPWQTMAHEYPWLIIVEEVIVHLLLFRLFNLVLICKRYDFL